TRVQSGDVNELDAAVYVVARLAVEASPHRGVASQACEIDPAGETLIAALRRNLRDREDSEEGNEEETDAHECSLYCWISIGYIAQRCQGLTHLEYLANLCKLGYHGSHARRAMKRYIFDPEVIDECAMACLGHRKPEMFDVFARAVEESYPGHIDNSQPWIYSIAGGAMIQMKLYFASLHEYVMIWGTPIGSEGHSGRHRVAFWDTVIDGETWYFAEGQFEKRIYCPGDRIFVGKGQACGMNFTDGVWAVEYARGPLLLSMPFGLADELFSALDLSTAVQTLSMYTSLIGRHWANKANRDYPLLVPFKKVSALFMNL